MNDITQQPKQKKKMTKADLIGVIVGFFIANIILQMGSFGFIPAFLIAMISYWVVKEIALSFINTKENKVKISTEKKVQLEHKIVQNTKSKTPKTKDSKNHWIWAGVGVIVLLTIIGASSSDTPYENISPVETDKSSDYSEQIGNLYRNTKYNFRIKFPEGWKTGTGDGVHIVQKANSGNSTISVTVQQFDLGGVESFSSIKDAGTSKKFIDTFIEGTKEKFSDVKMIDYGETKIDNEPAYWVEYSASSQILDHKLKMTNIIYYLAKRNTLYAIGAGTLSDEYSKIKPVFTQSIGTFVLENY